jgi:hypothetical protein
MSALETISGTIASLEQKETSHDVMLEFDVCFEDRRTRRAQWLALPGTQLREGDRVSVICDPQE